MNDLPFTFERSIWREAARLKRECPELLEAKTAERRKRNETNPNNLHQLRRSDPND